MSGSANIEISCGAVVYTRVKNVPRYLLVREKSGFWVFPKGHMEAGETERETAIREIKEETGLDVQFICGFRMTDEHTLAREGHPERLKRTVYFLAECKKQTFRPQQSEITKIALMDYMSAMNALSFDSFKDILSKAHAFLLALEE